MKQQEQIASFKAFHKRVPQIVEQLSKDDSLAISALANPLMAIEELGYVLTTEVRKKVERILLYPPAERKHLQSLEKDIHDLAGEVFDIDDEKEIDRILFGKLQLSKPIESLASPSYQVITKGAEFIKGTRPQWSDQLKNIENSHAIVPPLLSYRKLRADRPGFAARELYQQLRNKTRKLPVTKVQISFPGLHEDYDDA